MTPTSQVKRMKKNDLFSLKITDMGVDGEGIGKYDGMTFFVKDALIGDMPVWRKLSHHLHTA